MGNFHHPVPAFLDSLSSEVKLQSAGDQHKGPLVCAICTKIACLSKQGYKTWLY